MSSASIPENHQFQIIMCKSYFSAYFRFVMWLQETILWSLVAQGLVSSTCYWGWRMFSWRYLFILDKISKMKSMILKVFISWKHTVKNCSTKAWLFLVEAIRPLKCWSFSLFISCGSKEGVKCIVPPVIISKDESLWDPKGVSLRFRQCFQPSYFEELCKFWVPIMWLVCSTKPEYYGCKHSESVVKLSKWHRLKAAR